MKKCDCCKKKQGKIVICDDCYEHLKGLAHRMVLEHRDFMKDFKKDIKRFKRG